MRTTTAASPRRLHWQAAFTTKTYKAQASSLVFWQHVFLPNTPPPMPNGAAQACSSLLLTRIVKKPAAQNVVRGLVVDVAHQHNVSRRSLRASQ